jgi:hypothetical protein
MATALLFVQFPPSAITPIREAEGGERQKSGETITAPLNLESRVESVNQHICVQGDYVSSLTLSIFRLNYVRPLATK